MRSERGEPKRKLEGKVALVTGAGRGVGRAIALKLAAEGAHLVLNDLDEQPVREVAEYIWNEGGQSVVVHGSVTDADFADRFIVHAVDNFGGVDIIINNAGYTWDSVIQKTTDEQWKAILDVHLKAPFDILRVAQPVISAAVQRERSAGEVRHRKVVNISSIAGVFGNPGQANYASAKAGVIGLTKTLAKEWGRYRVNVNCVAFGLITTRATEISAEQGGTIDIDGRQIRVGVNPDVLARVEAAIPLGQAGTPEQAAGGVVMLTYPESDYITGQTLLVAGGYEG